MLLIIDYSNKENSLNMHAIDSSCTIYQIEFQNFVHFLILD